MCPVCERAGDGECDGLIGLGVKAPEYPNSYLMQCPDCDAYWMGHGFQLHIMVELPPAVAKQTFPELQVMSALRIGTVRASLEFVPNALVAFDQKLEVALDCHDCRRRCRTVIFRPDATHGVCTPKKHAFPGRILSVESRVEGNAHVAVFCFEYEHEPFRDAKYPDERRYGNKELGAPTWARVAFDVTCPACRECSRHSTQNNIVRPWRCVCRCGRPLYSETAEMPQLSWRTSEPT